MAGNAHHAIIFMGDQGTVSVRSDSIGRNIKETHRVGLDEDLTDARLFVTDCTTAGRCRHGCKADLAIKYCSIVQEDAKPGTAKNQCTSLAKSPLSNAGPLRRYHGYLQTNWRSKGLAMAATAKLCEDSGPRESRHLVQDMPHARNHSPDH